MDKVVVEKMVKVGLLPPCDGSVKCKQSPELVVEFNSRRRMYCISHARDAVDNEISRLMRMRV